jgi:hypothetical protein
MSPDDDETSQSRLPSNAVAYNGVVTPYNNGSTVVEGLPNAPDEQAHLTTGDGEFITDEKGNRIILGVSEPGRGSPAIFDSSAFAADVFTVNGSPLNDSAINGSDDDDIFSIDEPLPDISDVADDEVQDHPGEDEDLNQSSAREDYTKTVLNRTDNPPHGEAFLTDGNGSFLTDSAGNRLVVGEPEAGSTASNFGFAEGSGSTFGNGTFANFTYGQSADQAADSDAGSSGRSERSREALHQEMLDRVDRLEVLIRAQIDSAVNRGHNHPPQLLEVESPATQAQLQEVLTAIAEIRSEDSSAAPNPQNMVAQASVFQRVAGLAKTGPGWLALSAVGGIVGNRADGALMDHQHQIYMALMAAADAVAAWAHYLSILR